MAMSMWLLVLGVTTTCFFPFSATGYSIHQQSSTDRWRLQSGQVLYWNNTIFGLTRRPMIVLIFHVLLLCFNKRAKILPTVRALETTEYLTKEIAYIPWKSAVDNLDYFYLMFDRSEVYGPLQVNGIKDILKYNAPSHFAELCLPCLSLGLCAESCQTSFWPLQKGD